MTGRHEGTMCVFAKNVCWPTILRACLSTDGGLLYGKKQKREKMMENQHKCSSWTVATTSGCSNNVYSVLNLIKLITNNLEDSPTITFVGHLFCVCSTDVGHLTDWRLSVYQGIVRRQWKLDTACYDFSPHWAFPIGIYFPCAVSKCHDKKTFFSSQQVQLYCTQGP